MAIDPGIELLPDVPIAGPADDLLGYGPLAERVVELACAEPTAMPRVVGVVGAAGSGSESANPASTSGRLGTISSARQALATSSGCALPATARPAKYSGAALFGHED